MVTDDGQAVYGRFKKIVQDIHEAKQEFSAPDKHTGKVRLITVGALAKCFILPLLAEFTQRHPGIALEVLESGRTFGAGNHERDVVLNYGPLGDSGLVAKPLGYSYLWVAGSAAYFAQHGIPRAPLDLQRHRCLGYVDRATGRLTDWQFRDTGQLQGWRPPILHSFSNGESLVEATIQGLGLIWAPDAVFQGPVAQRQLIPVLQDYSIEMGPLHPLSPGPVAAQTGSDLSGPPVREIPAGPAFATVPGGPGAGGSPSPGNAPAEALRKLRPPGPTSQGHVGVGHHRAPVHHQGLAGYEGRQGAGQEQHRRGDVGRHAQLV